MKRQGSWTPSWALLAIFGNPAASLEFYKSNLGPSKAQGHLSLFSCCTTAQMMLSRKALGEPLRHVWFISPGGAQGLVFLPRGFSTVLLN